MNNTAKVISKILEDEHIKYDRAVLEKVTEFCEEKYGDRDGKVRNCLFLQQPE